jgi:hypothetical protein
MAFWLGGAGNSRELKRGRKRATVEESCDWSQWHVCRPQAFSRFLRVLAITPRYLRNPNPRPGSNSSGTLRVNPVICLRRGSFRAAFFFEPLGDIRRHRDGRSAHLRNEPKDLASWELLRNSIDFKHVSVRFLPDQKILERFCFHALYDTLCNNVMKICYYVDRL